METDIFEDDISSIRGEYDSGSDLDSRSVEDEDVLEEYSRPKRTRHAPHHQTLFMVIVCKMIIQISHDVSAKRRYRHHMMMVLQIMHCFYRII